MERKIIKYTIVAGSEVHRFIDAVNSNLQDGYELYSHTFHFAAVQPDMQPESAFGQAMVKYAEPEEK